MQNIRTLQELPRLPDSREARVGLLGEDALFSTGIMVYSDAIMNSSFTCSVFRAGSISLFTRTMVCILSAMSLFTSAFAQQAAPRIRVTWKQTVITVTRGDRAIAINMPEEIANYDAKVKVLFVRQTATSLYMLFEITGPSRGPNDYNKQCGAGIEGGLFLAEITSEWKLGRTQSIQTESCWNSIDTLERDYNVQKETLSIEVSDFHNMKKHTVRYDNHHPEQGLQRQETNLE